MNDIPNPNVGDEVEVTLFKRGGEPLKVKGRVSRKGPMSDPAFNHWKVRLEGMSVNVCWNSGLETFTEFDR